MIVGNYCVIHPTAQIHESVVIRHYVYLGEETIIKEGSFIDSYARSSGHNHIGKNVTIRFGATIARNVIIKDDVFISPNVMTIYLDHKKELTPQPTIIGEGAFIGTAAVIGAGVTIGAGVVIAAMAYVSKDCIEPGVYAGVPARKIK